jgi:basic membrane protein A and related proteins
VVVGAAAAVAGGAPAAAALAAHQSAAARVQAGLVTDIGGINDRSFNFLADRGLRQAAAALGFRAALRESHTASDYIPNIRRLVAQRKNVIVTVGFLMADATGRMARRSPGTDFAIVDFSAKDRTTINGAGNVKGLLFKEQQAGYLAGYAAGLVEKQPRGVTGLNGRQIVSAVGGQKIPAVDRYIAGFRAGAEAADPGVRVLIAYSQDLIDQAKCRQQALDQIEQGSDIVFQAARQCGLGALAAANDRGVWGIGSDADQRSLGPHVLTSAEKRVDVAVRKAITEVANGTFRGGGDETFGLGNGGVALGPLSTALPAALRGQVQAQVDRVRARIIAGKVPIPTTV